MITRKLVYDDEDKERRVIDQNEISAIEAPIIILGDPGLGKSVLTQHLGTLPKTKYFRAGSFVRNINHSSVIDKGERVVIDGLDEIASTVIGGGVEAVLSKLSALGNPSFILSCREADWRGATDRIKIEDDYNTTPVLLHLQPFEQADAQQFLSEEFPFVEAVEVLDHLADRGLEDIYGNPLTLRLLGEISQTDDGLPNSRAELFNRACTEMLKEENERHGDGSHVKKTSEELLLAAGALCAVQILCDHLGVFTGANVKTPQGYININDITEISGGASAADAIKTRLFQAESEQRFTFVHRVVAEFLGAKWLAHAFESGVSERRIFSLFRQGDGIPTSLRGLHAWIGYFNEVLARRCINADPYAVLRYGDADTLSVDSAKLLLSALKNLSDDDPYFRSEDWGKHSISGLMRPELREQIFELISRPRQHVQLSTMLTFAMVEGGMAAEFAYELNAMMFDQTRYFAERSAASKVLCEADEDRDWEETIQSLLSMGDTDSARLALEILESVSLNSFSDKTIVETILARIGLTVSPMNRRRSSYVIIINIRDRIFESLDDSRRKNLLDLFNAYARPLMRQGHRTAKAEVADVVRKLAVRAIETDPGLAPDRIWSWIGWLRKDDGGGRPGKEQLVNLIKKDQALRFRIIEYVLLTPCAENTRMAGYRLADTGLDIYPNDCDLASLLKGLRGRAKDSTINQETWRDVLGLGLRQEGISKSLQEAAVESANEDKALLDILTEMTQVDKPAWKTKQEAEMQKQLDERNKVYQTHREFHKANRKEIADGNYSYLYEAAKVYLGPCIEFDNSKAPKERLVEFLGDELAENALSGFIAVLNRSDLPKPNEVVTNYCKGNQNIAVMPMICGIVEMIRHGIPLDGIDRDILTSVLMAWEYSGRSENEVDVKIESALEEILLTSEKEAETYFRTSIEPQLKFRRDYIPDLYRLTNNTVWAAMIGRLSLEWIKEFSGVPKNIEKELLKCALKNAELNASRDLVIEMRSTVHRDYETMLWWLAADFLVDFDNCRANIKSISEDDPEFVWFVRDCVENMKGPLFSNFSVKQISFIINAFGKSWPDVGRPQGITSGNTNNWNATEFIEQMINSVANNISPEATDALRNMIGGPASTYDATIKHALALQRRSRRDREYVAPSLKSIRSVVNDDLPETIDDMRAYFADFLMELQLKIKGSNTDMWETYWNGDKPQRENFCRNRLIEQISGRLPPSIRFIPEMHMPKQRRADIAAIRNEIGLPVEIKGQWHKKVWNAASDQLDANYARDWHANGRGVYIVLWFGDVPKKQLPKHPDGLTKPTKPEALQEMLVSRIPAARRSQIDVFVIDVSKPA